MKSNEKILLASSFLFGGIVLGFLLAPIKKGIEIGNYSGNNYFPEKQEKNLANIQTNDVITETIEMIH